MPPKSADPGTQPGSVESDRVGIAEKEEIKGGHETGKGYHRVDK